jgi:hypothetical protein
MPRVGDTASIQLDAASDRVVDRWNVSAVELTAEPEEEHYLEAKLDTAEVASGDVATLTLQVRRLHPRQVAVVGIVSHLGTESHLWPIAVSMR